MRNGGRTPVAGLVHAFTLLLVILLAAPLARHIPLACMSAILINVALNMGDWHEFKVMTRYTRGRMGTLLITFSLTVVFDLTVAVEMGILWASILLIRRLAQVTTIVRLGEPDGDRLAHQVALFEARGTLFFGAAESLETLVLGSERGVRVVVLDLEHVSYMDSTAVNVLRTTHDQLYARSIVLLLCGVQLQPASLIRRSGFLGVLGPLSIFADRPSALQGARQILVSKVRSEQTG